MGVSALEGVKVLEYCRGISGAYCTKLMAGLGAEVIHIEAPGTGDATRGLPPFLGDVPHPEKSGLFLFLNAGKLGITLDPRRPEGVEIFTRLASDADVLVDDWPPGHMERMGLGYEDLRGLNAGLVMASITPFGRSGPMASYKAYGLNIAHASGQGYMLPLPSPHLERAPVKIGGNCTDYDAGQTAAVAVLAALFARGTTGRGQFVEVSQQEAVLSLQRIENVVFANGGEVLTRRGPDLDRMITQLFECADGWVVSVTPLEHQQQALARLVRNGSEPAAAGSPGLTREEVAGWMRERTTEEVTAKAQALSCPISPMSSPADVVASAQMTEREFFAETAHPVAGRIRMPAQPCRFSATPFRVERAPSLGEHNDTVYVRRLGYGPEEMRALEQAGVI